jgi:transcriptional regulator with XRE-family HTH domain
MQPPVEEFISRWEIGDITSEMFGEELRDLRRRMRIRLKDLAQTSKLTNATLSNLENSKRGPRVDTVIKVFAGLRTIQRDREMK